MKKLILENFGLKISAVVLSIFMWFFVTSRGQSEISFEFPIEFRNIPAGLGIVSSNAKSVNVAIRGQERLVKNVKTADLRVFLDLGKAKKGEGTYYINREAIKLPYSLSVTRITPLSVKVSLDEMISKTVLVKPSLTGLPETGFFVRSIIVKPRSIRIRGLKTEVRKVSVIKTEAFDITGLNETITQELNIDTANANITPETAVVRVDIVIEGEQ